MTLRRRVEALEGPKTPPVDVAAMDAEIRQLLGELGTREGSGRVQWQGPPRTPAEEAIDAEIQALLDAMRARS